jgi:hypothetical protein
LLAEPWINEEEILESLPSLRSEAFQYSKVLFRESLSLGSFLRPVLRILEGISKPQNTPADALLSLENT